MKAIWILSIALLLQCMLCSNGSTSSSSSQTNLEQPAIASFNMRQEMLRVDWQIPLSKLKCMDTGLPPKLNIDSASSSYLEEMYITVDIDLSKYDNSGIFEPDDIFFCLNESHSSQCIGSENLDYYQSNFRSSYLSLSKEIKPIVKQSDSGYRTQQYVTLTVSERLMELYSYKFVYDIVVKVWQKKPASVELNCPFDCLSRGTCVNGFCNCDSEFIGRACEFKLESIESDRRPKLGYMEVKWVRVDSPSPLILLDFVSGFFQFVTFTDSKRYKIASQYLLNRAQKIIIDKRYVLERDSSTQSPSITIDEEEDYLQNQSADQANFYKNSSVILCMFSYSKETHFGLVLNEKKITEIAAEQDKDLANTESASVKTILQIGLALIVIVSILLLRVVYKQYLEQKAKINVLKLYQSKEFREIAEELQHEDACRICLEGYQENTRVRIHHKCMKVFHKGCFDKWALTGNNQKCPQCRDEYEDELIEALQVLAKKEAQMKVMSEYDQANQESLNLSSNGDNQIEIPFVGGNVQLEMESVERNRSNNQVESVDGRQSLTPAQMLARIDRTGLFDEPSTDSSGIPNESLDNRGRKKYSQVPSKGSVDLSADYSHENQLQQQPRNQRKDSHHTLRSDISDGGDEENPNRQEVEEDDDEEYDEDEGVEGIEEEEDEEEEEDDQEEDEDDQEDEEEDNDDGDGDEDEEEEGDEEEDEEQDEDNGEEGEDYEDEEEVGDNPNEEAEEEGGENDDEIGQDGIEISEKSDQIVSQLIKK